MNSHGSVDTIDERTRTRKLVNEFLSCQHLLRNEEILEFLSGEETESGEYNRASGRDDCNVATWNELNHDECTEHLLLRQAFHRRRAEIRKLTANLHDGLGGARIDEDGRLVRATEPRQPPRANLPPLGNGNEGVDVGNNGGNAQINDNPGNALNDQQQQELFLEQKRRETELTIANAVKELRNNTKQHIPVPEEEFEVILLDPNGRPARAIATDVFGAVQHNNIHEDDEDNTAITNFLRRIAMAGFIVIAVVLCTILQVLPIGSMMTGIEPANPSFDSLLNEVLVVRGWTDHVSECADGLANRSENRHLNDRWEWLRRMRHFIFSGNTTIDCSEGVLHIPSKRVLNLDIKASPMESETDLRYYMHGVDDSWFMPCSGLHGQRILDRCFRGIHDDFVDDKEISASIAMGDILIQNGGDHFDVHHDVRLLNRKVPGTVAMVKSLLESFYLNRHQHNQNSKKEKIRPVAFRVLTTGPMDGHDVKLKQDGDSMSMYLTDSSALNETNYLNWVLNSRQHNDRARSQSYYRPWPYRLEPKRETCDLKFDLEADSRFCIQSSLHLTSGAGEDYTGGTDLFVDDHPSNFANPSRRIARGVSIDGSRGRLVVSTGGFENLKCRFPTRTGFRTVLQIWWDCLE